MKLNRKVELGMKAVNVLKGHTAPVNTADLASELGTTANFLSQVMRNLRVAGVVANKRGPGGGYVLTSTTVTAYQVAQAVGRNLSVTSDGTATSRLSKAIADAYASVYV